MSHRVGFTVLVLVGVFGIAAITADKPPETYQNAMKDLGAFAQGIGKAVADNDYDAIQKYSVSAVNAFTVAEMYWKGKGDKDATKIAQDGGKMAADLGVAAGLKSPEGVAYAAKGATDVCMGCHAVHREQMPDGTFQIK